MTPTVHRPHQLARSSIPVGLLVGLCCAALLALVDRSGDYQLGISPTAASIGDNPAPAIDALVRSRIDVAFDLHPWMGSLSLILRWPFAALGDALGAGELTIYRLGTVPCLLALALVTLALDRRLAGRGRSLGTRLITAGVCLVNPATVDALLQGHPEELLTASLCVGAVLAAGRRPMAAGLLLGSALGTKQWALVAAPVVLVAVPAQRRWGSAAIAAAVAAGLTVPLLVASPDRLWSIVHQASRPATVGPANVWFPFAETRVRTYFDGEAVRTVTGYGMPEALRPIPRPLILLAALALCLLLARRGRPSTENAMGLLALCFLLRCLLDPVGLAYYYAPFLLALTAFETQRWDRPPILALVAAAGVWVTFNAFDTRMAVSVAWAVWALPMALALAVLVFRRALAGPSLDSAR